MNREPRRGDALTTVLGVLAALSGAWCLLTGWLVVSSALGLGDDPHGYGAIFGFLALLLGLPFLLAFSSAWLARRRR